MDTQILEYLLGKYSEEIKVIQENLGTGVAKDYAEYRELCGVLRGLLTAQREINDLLQRKKDYDDSL